MAVEEDSLDSTPSQLVMILLMGSKMALVASPPSTQRTQFPGSLPGQVGPAQLCIKLGRGSVSYAGGQLVSRPSYSLASAAAGWTRL